MNMCKDPDLMPERRGLQKALREPLLKTFPAALLGRIVTIPYYPLSDDMIRMIRSSSWAHPEADRRVNHEAEFHVRDEVSISSSAGAPSSSPAGG
jgi:type VI secretion system protein VasG